MKVTERAVVSVGTVSRALNNDIHIAPDARASVSVILCELGDVANLVQGMVDGLLLILLRNPASNIGTLMNASFPLVLIDHQGAVRLYPAIAYPFALKGMRGKRAC